jgi:hypothetical protein
MKQERPSGRSFYWAGGGERGGRGGETIFNIQYPIFNIQFSSKRGGCGEGIGDSRLETGDWRIETRDWGQGENESELMNSGKNSREDNHG